MASLSMVALICIYICIFAAYIVITCINYMCSAYTIVVL